MKILLISPSRYLDKNRLLKRKWLLFPSITLPLLAALTPSDIEVEIIDELFSDIDFDAKVDLVGITAYSSSIYRAYEIADEFRKRKTYVVMGGIHVSMQPDEALGHANTIITGEAEDTWPQFIKDFKKKIPQSLYRDLEKPSLKNLPVPRFSLIQKQHYLTLKHSWFFPAPIYSVQTARGCPHNCDYCAVTAFSGGQYRPRPIADVVAEIKTHKAKGCVFLDDNIFAQPQRARKLFEALIPLNIFWAGQGNLSAAEDRSLIRLASRSGCIMLSAGVESIVPLGLKSVNKRINKIEDYARQNAIFRAEGISVMASMIFGLEGEDSSVFQKAQEFLVKNRFAYTIWHPLVPFPGTALYARFVSESKLNEEKWWLNKQVVSNFLNLKFKGIAISQKQFRDDFLRHYKSCYSLLNIAKRVLWPIQKKSLARFLLNLLLRSKISANASMFGI
jgi:radical SAM superfamily enzyme YgiQ (UPF0313 family)